MRIWILSHTGYNLGIAPFLSGEGHAVISHVGSFSPNQEPPPDIGLFDSNSFLELAESLREAGTKVLGMSTWTNLMNTDIAYRQSLIKAIGYKIAKPEAIGTECTVSLWFNGQACISKSVVFNYEHFMPGNIGAKVPSAGYVAMFNVEKSKLVNEVLAPLEKFLRKANHRGAFSVKVLVDANKEIYVKDVSANIHEAFTQAVYENSRRSKSDIILDMFNEGSKPIPYTDPYVAGVMLSVYPFPYTIPELPVEVVGLNQLNRKHMWCMDLTTDSGRAFCGSFSGCLGYVTARGQTVQEACRRVYRTISNLKIDNIQYRNDIGKDVSERLYKLREAGVL